MSALKDKSVVLGITGGIAAYKAAELCRLLVKAGARVRVVMTAAAQKFIGPLTLQTLSGAPVADDLFQAEGEGRIGHIRLCDEADVIIVAPATADSIARFSSGRADDLLAAVVLASRAPVLLAPAMNVNMWTNPLVQQNLGRLTALGRFRTVGPDAGELACGWVGEGRLIEPSEIVAAAARLVTPQDLAGRTVVVTAGPTFEALDDVRFIGNRSSGKMGFALADNAACRGAEVTLIAGPVALPTPPGAGLTRRDVESTAQLRGCLAEVAGHADIVVMAAAVADFRPATRTAGKLSRRARVAEDEASAVPLVPNPDLLAELGQARRSGRPFLVGFAAEVGGDGAARRGRATEKLHEKGCDVIVMNDVGAPGIGFGSDDNAVTLMYADGTTDELPRASKAQIASELWDRLAPRLRDLDRPLARAGSPRRGAVVRPGLTLAARSPGRGRRG